MLITEPKPPPSCGHRKARTAAPKPDRPRPKNVTMPRLKNCRRVTLSTSGSGGTQAAASCASRVATAPDAGRSPHAGARSTRLQEDAGPVTNAVAEAGDPLV